MGSKAPPSKPQAPDLPEADNDESVDPHLTADLARTAQLQRRIADTLGLPPGALQDPRSLPNAVVGSDGAVAHEQGRLTQECADLVAAYTRIRDPEERRRYLALIEQAAAADQT